MACGFWTGAGGQRKTRPSRYPHQSAATPQPKVLGAVGQAAFDVSTVELPALEQRRKLGQ